MLDPVSVIVMTLTNLMAQDVPLPTGRLKKRVLVLLEAMKITIYETQQFDNLTLHCRALK